MATTRERIIELRMQDPDMKAVRMAELLGISREAVRQILVKLKIPTNFWRPPALCIDCGKLLGYNHSHKRCFPCYSKFHHTTLICDGCGVSYELRLSEAKTTLKRNKHHFHNYSCRSKWLGRTYGFKKKGG